MNLSLGPVSCTLGTNLNAKRLTVGSFLTTGLTTQLALGSTVIFISLKLLLYNNAIALGGSEQWAQCHTVWCWSLTGWYRQVLPPSLAVSHWSHSSASKGGTGGTSYSQLHELSIWAKKPQREKMWKVTFWFWHPSSGLDRGTLPI